jgi:hypothetical protein
MMDALQRKVIRARYEEAVRILHTPLAFWSMADKKRLYKAVQDIPALLETADAFEAKTIAHKMDIKELECWKARAEALEGA